MCYYREGTTPSDESSNNHPEAGWIYNSNSLEGQSDIYYNFLLSPDANDSGDIFGINSDGRVTILADDVSIAVRPVLYLKSSINIISGEGTEQNPYVLSNQ